LAFAFDGKNIQIHIEDKLDKNIKTIFIKYENDSYSITKEEDTVENAIVENVATDEIKSNKSRTKISE